MSVPRVQKSVVRLFNQKEGGLRVSHRQRIGPEGPRGSPRSAGAGALQQWGRKGVKGPIPWTDEGGQGPGPVGI